MSTFLDIVRGACGIVFVFAVGDAAHLSFWPLTAGICYVLWAPTARNAHIRDAVFKLRRQFETDKAGV